MKVGMELEERDYYEEKYENFSYLLLKFMLDTYYPERKDEDTIRRFVEEMCSESIKGTLKEGREILELQPFPWEWVYNVCGYLSLDYIEGKSKEEKYFKWVTWMLEALEEEAKRVEKL
jgi:hypothetical protein